MSNILVIGCDGQLGKCIQDAINSGKNRNDDHWIFTCRHPKQNSGKVRLDALSRDEIKYVLGKTKPEVVINCAAYTNVANAEGPSGMDDSYKANVEIPENLVGGFIDGSYYVDAKPYIIHISTDYVFDGNRGVAYTETDEPNPINIYGDHKLCGENEILKYEGGIVIRTSWLYSKYGRNFANKVLCYGKSTCDDAEMMAISVCDDEIGTPTYAPDLADAIVEIVNRRSFRLNSGIYHFANCGVCSRYDMARAILDECGSNRYIERIKSPICYTDDEKVLHRPKFSALDTTKIEYTLLKGYKIPYWRDSIYKFVKSYN